MKKLAGLVVILAALILGGYYGMGVATERTVKRNLEIINTSNGLFVNVVEYHRGWFTSTAIFDWRLHVPEHVTKSADGTSQMIPAQDYQMRMPLTVYHGPIIIANKTIKFGLGYATTDIAIPEQYKEKFNTHFTADSIQPALDLSLFVTYLNSSQLELSIPTFKLIAKDGGQFDWMGMESSMKVTSNADKVKGGVTLSGMQFKKDDTSAVIGEITSDYNLHKTDQGLYLGDANMSFPSFVVNNKDQKIFELNNFDVHTSSDIDDGLFSMHFKSTLDKIIANNKNYGPGTLEMALRNLDAVVLGRINQQVNAAQQGSELEKQQALMAILPEVPKLFSRGPEFEISELSFVMPEGTVEGSLLVSLPKSETANPLELIQKVTGKGRLKVPAEILKLALNQANKQKAIAQQLIEAQNANAQQPAPDATNPAATAPAATPTPDLSQQINTMTESQLNAMVQSGLLTQNGTDYVVELELNQGQLQINGKPFNPEMVKF